MDNQRVFIWVGVAVVAYMNYAAYEHDYGPPPLLASTEQTAPAPSSVAAPSQTQRVPLPATSPGAAPDSTVPAVDPLPQTRPGPATEHEPAQLIHVRTDVLDMDISTQGGEVDRADLLAYPQKKESPNVKVRLFDNSSPLTRFVFESGLSNSNGMAPDHNAYFKASATSYVLADGKDDLEIPLTWSESGISVTKTFVVHRGHYTVDVRYAVQNNAATVWSGFEYGTLVRHYEPVSRTMWNPETYAYRGPAFYDGTKYARIDVSKPVAGQLPTEPVSGAWAAAIQHHFAAVYVPDAATPFRYSFDYKPGGDYAFAAAGPVVTVASGSTGVLHSTLYVGPKLKTELERVTPTLTYTNDHGKFLTPLAKPLFWALSFVHSLVGNWGVAIILVTLLIKLLFYKLAETSGRSMARMRNLQPRMKDIQERYKDNREELGKQMMELYKREKINPVAGCLPMLVQIPVFIAFYWVLLESVEMRHAPFLLWIQDLSSKDPYFILPAIMGATMFMQFKMNPAPPDPMQAKIFAFMPLVMTATMSFFPAGLVLYWITNTGLSILQQWHINKIVALEGKKARA